MDKILYFVIYNLPFEGKNNLLQLFNNLINALLPISQEEIIILILKPNKESSNPGNFRPMVLISCSLKVLENIIEG